MARVRIRKVDGRWTSSRPAFGFSTADVVTTHASWKNALKSAEPKPGNVSAVVERGEDTWTSPDISASSTVGFSGTPKAAES